MADFSLAGLLRLRRRQEDQAAGALLRARSRASELAAQRTGVREAMLEHPEEAGSIEALHAIAAARASTSSMLADLRSLQVEHEAEVDRAAAAHEKARAARIALEKLETRHAEAQIAAELRGEQAVLDELAGRPARRNPGEDR
ncbi:flagellar FliJ family protein [Naasia sp. SYSU D00948]|uniref:flagellar FliJ family protein n=1 Tax=Naasia sp. SYSU D00948 TaxID=2817379 RepID=UPI001B307A05|nr:flagellar FliJ family protein [Naasia sp. SYSU D00948]